MTAISEIAKAPTVLQAALGYARAGISVMPCRGKEPALKSWRQQMNRRASAAEIQRWHTANLFGNVAVVLGWVSGGLIVIDLDGENAVTAFSLMYPELWDETYVVTSGSGIGAHVYLYADDVPTTTRVIGSKYGNIELRSQGTYVIAPPSIHPTSGKPYSVFRDRPVLRVAHLLDVQEWIKRLMAQKHGGKLPPPTGRRSEAIVHATNYGRASLANAVAAVTAAPPGARNDTLNLQAFKMGRLVAARQLDRADVEAALLAAAAALAQSDGETTVLRTIKSGLDAGIIKPLLTGSRP